MRTASRRIGILLAMAGSAAAQGLSVSGAMPAGLHGLVGDVDGDGHADYLTNASQFVVHSGATGAVLPWLTRPLGTGNTTVDYVAVGDVDADGRDDLAYYQSASLGPNAVTVVSGADGSALHSWSLSTPPVEWVAVAGGADCDADGFDDVVMRYGTSQSFVLEVRSGRNGAILLQQTHPANGFEFHFIASLGDLDGDGYEDVRTETFSTVGFYGSSNALFGPDFVIGQWIGNNALAIGDANGNGTIDLFRGLAPSFEIVDGSGVTLWSAAGYWRAWGLGDLDGDGGADFLVNDPANTYAVLSGRTLTSLPGTPPNNSTYAIGDVDHDGRAEAATGGSFYQWVDPTLPTASRMVRRGAAGSTSSGSRPRLVTRGHAGLGHEVFFDLRGALPGGITLLAAGPAIDVDLAPFGAPGNRAFLDLQAAWPLPTDAHGLGRAQFTMPTAPALLGAATTVQCVVLDPAANALGLVTSNAIDVETRN